MKSKILLIIIVGMIYQSYLTAQNEASRGKYGVAAGITSTRVFKGIEGEFFLIFATSDIDVNVDRDPIHYGLFADGLIYNDLNRRVRFQIEPGFVYANANTVRRINRETNFFGIINRTTEIDRIRHKMILAELPIKTRFFFAPIEKRTLKNSFFFDVGLKLTIPFVNKSTFIHDETNEEEQSGKATLDTPISLLFGMGISIGDKQAFTIDWTGIQLDQFNINGMFTKIGFNYYFRRP
jgi:hypothetical protein